MSLFRIFGPVKPTLEGETYVAQTETTLFTILPDNLITGWIILPGNNATWTINIYVPASAQKAWFTHTLQTGSDQVLFRIPLLLSTVIANTTYDIRITVKSDASKEAPVRWSFITLKPY